MAIKRALFLVLPPLLAACSPASDGPVAAASSGGERVEKTPIAAADDGTYLARIDPLGGQWKIATLGERDFAPFEAWVNFSEGGFLNHGAGCAGGFPAFYQLDGERIAVTRREPIRTGLCGAAPAPQKAAADASERRLAGFIDQLASWRRLDDQTLELTARDGTRAVLTRPAEPHPELAGRWIIESIGGEPLVTERRPPTLAIGMSSIGAYADCNSFGGQFALVGPGRIVVSGPLVSTAIGCAPEDRAEDDLMARAITAATGYRIEGDRLALTGGPGLVARRPPAPDRRLAGEYQHCGNTLLGAYHKGPVTLTIDAETMRDNAHCTARYTARGPELELQLDDSPACSRPAPAYVPGEPVGIGGDISFLALARPTGYAFNEQGQLIVRTSRGLLTLCRKGTPPPFGSG